GHALRRASRLSHARPRRPWPREPRPVRLVRRQPPRPDQHAARRTRARRPARPPLRAALRRARARARRDAAPPRALLPRARGRRQLRGSHRAGARDRADAARRARQRGGVSHLALVVPPTSPARPGPGPVPETALRALDLTVRRRIESLLAGDHRAASLGIAMELAQVRPYQPGDDVRLIDWNATARMNEPHVRLHVAERALTTWLLFDASQSMGFGTALRRKADVAEGVVLAVGHVASRRGNRLGLLTYGHPDPLFVPPRQGRVGLVGVLLKVREVADLPDDYEVPESPDTLGDALSRTRRHARDRAL